MKISFKNLNLILPSAFGMVISPASGNTLGGVSSASGNTLGVVSSASGNTLNVAPVSRRVSTETCPSGVGIVHCQSGMAYDANGNALTGTSGAALTCAAACGDLCCSGTDACTGFTGSVCLDNSCMNDYSCHYAGNGGSIGLISGGSCNGWAACYYAGYNGGGSVGQISGGSCVNDKACHEAGSRGGSVGLISGGSCVGSQACDAMGYNGGSVGDITGSCKADKACERAADASGDNITSIENCCNTDEACKDITNDAEAVSRGDCTALVTPSPTNLPTNQPTPVPTPSPTPSPITASDNWSIGFLSAKANFTQSSDKELILAYDISKDRNFSTSFLQKDCKANITGLMINTTYAKTDLNETHDKLIIFHSIDKSKLGSSQIWSNSTNDLEACQVVKLFVPKDGSRPKMDIAVDNRQIGVKFDLTADYAIVNVALNAATINTGNSTASLASFLRACHCNGVAFICTQAALKPNDELKVCIYSDSPDVLVGEIESMVISQEDGANFTVIDNTTVKFPGITKSQKVKEKYGVVASTRIPINLFNFEANNAKIGISGNVLMQLTDDSRRLQEDADSIVAGNEEASFDLEVSLQQEFGSDEDPIVSAASLKSKGVVSLGLLFALAYTMW